MLKWTLACLMAVLVLGAGCAKKSITTAGAVAAKQQSRATPELAAKKSSELGQAAAADDELIADTLKRLAPQYGFGYSEDNASLVGPGTPPEGRKLPLCVADVHAKLPQGGAAINPQQCEEAVRTVLQAMQDAGAKVTGTTPAAAGQAGSAAPQEPPKPVIPRSIAGLWRTVREEGESFSAEHDDQYYDQMTITDNGRLGINVIREGKLFAQQEFGYRYDKSTGKLTLLDNTGGVRGAMFFTTYLDRPDLLYVKEEGNDIVKVYKNIGGAAQQGKPQPPGGGPSPTAPHKRGK
jgi:hypothetical protein